MLKRKQRQEYQKVSIELKTKVAKYATGNGIKAVVKKFQDQEPNATKNWKNMVHVHDWKDAYLCQVERKIKAGDLEDVVLPVKK